MQELSMMPILASLVQKNTDIKGGITHGKEETLDSLLEHGKKGSHGFYKIFMLMNSVKGTVDKMKENGLVHDGCKENMEDGANSDCTDSHGTDGICSIAASINLLLSPELTRHFGENAQLMTGINNRQEKLNTMIKNHNEALQPFFNQGAKLINDTGKGNHIMSSVVQGEKDNTSMKHEHWRAMSKEVISNDPAINPLIEEINKGGHSHQESDKLKPLNQDIANSIGLTEIHTDKNTVAIYLQTEGDPVSTKEISIANANRDGIVFKHAGSGTASQGSEKAKELSVAKGVKEGSNIAIDAAAKGIRVKDQAATLGMDDSTKELFITGQLEEQAMQDGLGNKLTTKEEGTIYNRKRDITAENDNISINFPHKSANMVKRDFLQLNKDVFIDIDSYIRGNFSKGTEGADQALRGRYPSLENSIPLNNEHIKGKNLFSSLRPEDNKYSFTGSTNIPVNSNSGVVVEKLHYKEVQSQDSMGVKVDNLSTDEMPLYTEIVGNGVDSEVSRELNFKEVEHLADMDDISNQIVESVKYSRERNIQQFDMELVPEELGRIRVRLVEEGGKLGAYLSIESQTVAEQIQAQLPSFRESLLNEGIVLEEVYVDIDQESGGDQDWQGQDSQREFTVAEEVLTDIDNLEEARYDQPLRDVSTNPNLSLDYIG